MPYLQLDVNERYPVAEKQRLAAHMCETYARMMSVDIRRISVAIRELGEGGVWRIAEAGSSPQPVAMLMLDIRRGRPAELRIEADQARNICVRLVVLERADIAFGRFFNKIPVKGLPPGLLVLEPLSTDLNSMAQPVCGNAGQAADGGPGERGQCGNG